MTFLTPLMLAGAAAAALPLVIHLLHRSRYQTVAWGAMHLLQDVVASSRRRMRWHHWLLLLVRCLIPVVLAMMMARPILTGFRALAGDAPIGLVVVLDDSASMDAEAKAAAVDVLRAAPAGSDLAVVLAGSPPQTLLHRPTTSADRLVTALDDVRFKHDAAAVDSSLALAESTLQQMTQPTRELVVVSDFQTRDWTDVPPASDDDVRTTWLPIASEPAAAVTQIQLPARPITTGQTIAVRVTVADPAGGSAEVAIVSDSIARQSQSVQLDAGREQVVDFAVPLTDSDAVVLTASLRKDDAALAAAEVVVDPLRRVSVVLVDGQPSTQPLGGEVGYLGLALGPLGQVGADGRDLFDVRTVPPRDLRPVLTDFLGDLIGSEATGPDLVVLGNVDRLPVVTVSALEQYVQAGGALWLTAGDAIDADWARQTLGPAGLLPRPWAGVQSVPTTIFSETYTHPAVVAFNDETFGSLAPVHVDRWYQLEADQQNDDGTDDAARPTVVLRLRDGSPLLIEAATGNGVVLQWTTTIDDAWTDLPRQGVFVPLVQQIGAATAARSRPRRNLSPGDPLRRSNIGAAVLTRPDGRQEPIAAGQSIITTDTRAPGRYRLVDGNRTDSWVVAIDSGEQVAERMTDAEIARLAEAFDAAVADDAADYLNRDRTRRHGRDLWGDLWKLLLALLVVEVLIQQVRPRHAAGAPLGGLAS